MEKTEQQIEEDRKKFIENLNRPVIEDPMEYSSKEVNWVEDNGNLKARNIDECSKYQRLFFLATPINKIIGRPQLVDSTLKRIILLRKVLKIETKRNGDERHLVQYKFIGDLYDKRYDGQEVEILAFDFWIYRVITEEGKEYYILSDKQLPNEVCEFNGMNIVLDDVAEISKSMKIKSLSNVFILKDCIPSVKILPKEDLVKFTKEREITEQYWLDFLALHPLGNINRFPQEMELLRSAFVLSGKTENYPLHLGIMGRAGTKKTMGHIETLSYKLADEPHICEGAASRIKGLGPSFKEKPADIGFLAKAHRIGFIDEIGKMVEAELNKHDGQVGNVLGELNFLLEHKKRSVSSGNNNECQVQATSKFMFVTNPVKARSTIHNHVGVIDPTTMSRILWWVQDSNETNFCLGPEAIKSPPHQDKPKTSNINIKGFKSWAFSGGLSMCPGELGGFSSREEFLTIFDTCYSFLCELDEKEVQRLNNLTTTLASEPMKSNVWKPRANHHIKLLIDGLVKHRCLFKDYDPTFTPKQEDYDLAEKILIRMVKSWNFNLT